MRPLSGLHCDRPCRSNFGSPADDRLVLRLPEGSLRARFATRPQHYQIHHFLPSSASKPDCHGIIFRGFVSRQQQEVASFVRICHVVSSNVQSSAQSRSRLGNSNRILEGANRRVHATSSILKKMLHCWNPSTKYDRTSRRSTVHSYIPDTRFFRNFLVRSS